MNLYETQYRSLQFERAGLFKAIQEKYKSVTVLYPGCSAHITPSLYFPHVVYVDQSDAAAQFFGDERSLAEFLNRHKHHKGSVYIRFLQQDYLQPLPLRENSYDLLLALFAGGIARSCTKYLKVGGLLLTNNHQGDAMDGVHQEDLKLSGTIRFQKQAYEITEENLDEQKIPLQKLNSKYLKQVSQGIAYVENETYYLFQRLR